MTVIIGVDPHKATHTAVVIDPREEVLASEVASGTSAGLFPLPEGFEGCAVGPRRAWPSADALGDIVGGRVSEPGTVQPLHESSAPLPKPAATPAPAVSVSKSSGVGRRRRSFRSVTISSPTPTTPEGSGVPGLRPRHQAPQLSPATPRALRRSRRVAGHEEHRGNLVPAASHAWNAFSRISSRLPSSMRSWRAHRQIEVPCARSRSDAAASHAGWKRRTSRARRRRGPRRGCGRLFRGRRRRAGSGHRRG